MISLMCLLGGKSMESNMKTLDLSFPQALRSMTDQDFNEYDVHTKKASITFLGRNITSTLGIQLFKFMSIVIPLIPTVVLVLYNGIQLEALITRSNMVASRFSQVQNAISLSVLASCLQDERYSLVFYSLSTTKGERVNQR